MVKNWFSTSQLLDTFNVLFGNGKFHIPSWTGILFLGITAGCACLGTILFIWFLVWMFQGWFIKGKDETTKMAKKARYWRKERILVRFTTFFLVFGLIASGCLLILDYILVITHETANATAYVIKYAPPSFKNYLIKNNIETNYVGFNNLLKEPYVHLIIVTSWVVSATNWVLIVVCWIIRKVLTFKIRRNERKVAKEVAKRE